MAIRALTFMLPALLAGTAFFSPAAGCHCGRTKVTAGGSVEMYTPDSWRTSPASEEDLGTSLWLFNGEYGAAVRVVVVPSTKLTPIAAAGMLLPELSRYRYCFSPDGLPAEDAGQDVALECRDELDDEIDTLLVVRPRSARGPIVVFVGVWTQRFSASAGQDLRDIAASVRPVGK